jgi:hypothetical protein
MSEDVLHQLPCTPDRRTMEEFVGRVFSALGMRGLVELSWTSVRLPHKLEFARQYDIGDLERLIDDAEHLNANPSCNVYISAGLRRSDIDTKHRAKDDDVQSVVAFWADFDKPGSLDAGLKKAKKLGITPNMVTYTGKHPHLRGQMWWTLDEPCEDFKLHEELMRKLALELGADRSVINRSRVMRLIGSVAWPLKAERTLEMTGYYEVMPRAAYYTLDELQSKLRGVASTTQRNALYDFSTAEPTIETQDLIALSVEPHKFHENARTASARLIAQGMRPEDVYGVLAGAVRAAGVNVPERLVQLKNLVTGAAAKFKPVDQPTAPAPSPVEGTERTSPFMSIAQLLAQPAPEYIIEKFLIERGMAALFGAPGTFKTFIALDLGLSVAHGLPWHGFATRQKKVLYICAEGQYGFGARALVWQQERAAGRDTDQFVLLPVPVNFLQADAVGKLLEDMQIFLGDVGLVIIDTLARNFGTGDENKTQDMNAFVKGVSRLAKEAMVLIVHHTGKDEGKDERGSSAFRAALDAAFRLKREPGSDFVRFDTKKQKEGEEHAPLSFVMAKAEAPHPTTGELLGSRIPTLTAETSPTSLREPTLTRGHLAILSRLRALGPSSVSVLARDLGKDKGNLSRQLRLLADRELTRQDPVTGIWSVKNEEEDD